MQKKELRKKIKMLRGAIPEQERLFASHKACLHVLKSEMFLSADAILSYMAVGDEADPFRIATAALHEHKAVAFPRCKHNNPSGLPDMDFFCVHDAAEETLFYSQFIKNSWNIWEPKPLKRSLFSCRTFKNKKITVIVPGSAFSANGSRLGWGRGYYDTYLMKLKEDAESHDCIMHTIGFCFDCQLVTSVPVEVHDVKMDFVVSQSGIINCNA
ncbi:MAG: 5-formyltetrahydrofolate cyclo-ligase [Treponema sp.]|nr:5-formyltetrahydrofolate cyclo-ligase [Treponema sp.]